MTDRDRLIELVDKAKEEYANDITDHTETDYIVETLLNEGVIVPPCEVGDMVYVVENPYDFVPLKKPLECEVVAISQREHGLYLRVLFDTKKINGCCDYNLNWKLCKTIFLTKEEAEAELRKRGEQNA